MLSGLDPLDAERVAQRAAGDCRAALRRPVTCGAVQVSLGVGAGVAVGGGRTTTPDRLLAEADAAMYLEKLSRTSNPTAGAAPNPR